MTWVLIVTLRMASNPKLPAAKHSVPSPDGAFVATLQRTRLLVRCAISNDLIQSWTLPQEFVSRCFFIRWDAESNTPTATISNSSRLLLADSQTVRVFDVEGGAWKATIENATSNVGQISNVAFGDNSDSILVFSDFGVKLTIWSLVTSRGVEVRDPKLGEACYDLRPGTKHLALLTRPSAQDNLMILAPKSQNLLKSVELGTIDAQEVQWSKDGRWLAVRDTPSAGHSVHIYTADGHRFRTFNGAQDLDEVGLGLKSMIWSPAGSLILGDYNGAVTLLNKTTFSPFMHLKHRTPIDLPTIDVWNEQIKANLERSYIALKDPASPPASSMFIAKTATPKQGIALPSLNMDGTMLATRDDSIPTTVWVWSLQSCKPVTVIIHHSPIRYLAWHPVHKDLLLMHCAISEPVIHLWKSNWIMPVIVTLPLTNNKGKLEAKWLQSSDNDHFKLLLSSQTQTIDARISLAGDLMADTEVSQNAFQPDGSSAEDMFDEGNSLDLSPVKFGTTTEFAILGESGSGFGVTDHGLDDTFHYQKQLKASG